MDVTQQYSKLTDIANAKQMLVNKL